MKKMGGRICDSCNIIFNKDEHIVEMCERCANTVWCVFDVFEDGHKNLSSIHRTKERAFNHIKSGKDLMKEVNATEEIKLTNQIIVEWMVF